MRVCLSDVRLSVASILPKSGTERPRKTKIDREVAQVTRDSDTTFRVKRSKANLQGAGAYCGGLPHSLLLGLGGVSIILCNIYLFPRISATRAITLSHPTFCFTRFCLTIQIL